MAGLEGDCRIEKRVKAKIQSLKFKAFGRDKRKTKEEKKTTRRRRGSAQEEKKESEDASNVDSTASRE